MKSLGSWIQCFFPKRSSTQKPSNQSRFNKTNQKGSPDHNVIPKSVDSSNNGSEPEPSAPTTYVSTRGRNLSAEEIIKETLMVELYRKEDDGDLGLVVTGGVDKDSPPRVAYLKPDGIAFRSDLLEVGDLLVSVNGVDTTLLRHFEIVNMLQSSTNPTVLELQYSLPDPYQMSFSVMCKRIEVRLMRDAEYGTFGMTLRGGASKDPRKCRPLTVTQLRLGGPAEREGTLKVGDRILAINGVNMTQRTLMEVLHILQELMEAAFLVEYDVSVLEVVQNATGPLLVEIDKLPGYSLGLTLSRALYHGRPVLVIDSINAASIADRCGALHTGDHLLSIDGVSLENVSVTETNRLLSSNSGSQLQLEVVPGALVKADTEIIGAESESESLMWSQGGAVCASGAASSSGGGAAMFPSASLNSVSSLQSRGTFNSMTTQVGSALSSFGSTRDRSCVWDSLTRQAAAAGNALLSYGLTQVCHVDTTEVMLIYEQRSFGLTIDAPPGRSVGSAGMLMEPPIITHIEPRGPAERCGVLQEGDRVLAINGQYLEGRTMDEVREMVEESGVKMLLLVEFNVAESIIPSSGVFVVKLAKRNAGLGITISCPRNRRPGQHLVISDVKKGSVAQRTGSIQPGDKLLAIDNVRLDNCTLEDSARVLQDTQDIVKLTIKKDENFADEPDPTHLITYTVELPKFAGPLGITISGSEEPFDPIFISSLTDGGLAEKTGALHVGDRLLAINGVSLRGKTLSDAVQLLQNAGQTVTLKITRPAHKGDTENQAAGKHGSMDSALESWDSSGLDTGNKSFNRNQLQEPHTSKGSSSSNSQRKVNESGGTGSDKGGRAELLINEDQKETEAVWDFVTVTSPSTSVPPSCCSSGGDEWSRQVDELDQLRAPGLDSFSDLPDITEVTGDNLDCHSTAIDAGYVTVDEMEARNSFMKGDDFVVSGGVDAVSDITTADIHLKEVEEQLQNIFTPTPIELMKVTLYKQNDSDDFGFSLSDGVFEKGVYVGAVKPNGPATEVLRPYDRLLQVNSVRTKDLDCCQVVPLIARAGNRVDLVISRNPLVWGSSETPEYSPVPPLMQEKDHCHSTTPVQGTVPRNSKSRRVAFSMDPESTA